MNTVALHAEVSEIEPLRHTPAGIPLLQFRLLHRSQQVEAGFRRQVECELSAVAMGEVAIRAAALKVGQTVRVRGFLNRKSRMSKQIVLHATEAVISEDDNDGDGKTGQ